MKWLIYGFHMPIFLGVSGYLFNRVNQSSLSLGAFFQRYWKRMLLPWLIAFVAFSAISGEFATFAKIAMSILRPHYHLWFVPVLFVFVLIATRVKLPTTALFVIALAVSVVGFALFGFPHYKGPLAGMTLPDDRYLTMAVFFFAGLWVSQRATIPVLPASLLAIAGLGLWQYEFWNADAVPTILAYVGLNLALIATLPVLVALPLRSSLLEFLGQDSLYFYLWHLFLFRVLTRLFQPFIGGWLLLALVFGVTMIVLLAARPILARFPVLALLSGVQPSAATLASNPSSGPLPERAGH